MLINRSKLKDIAGSIQVSKEFYEEFEKEAEKIIIKACKRARDNKRTTVMARDI